jgi:hypothetical protein
MRTDMAFGFQYPPSLRAKRSNPFIRTESVDCFAEFIIGRAFARPVGSQ